MGRPAILRKVSRQVFGSASEATSSAKKFYAVAVGREGPKIYDKWNECKEQITKYPAVFKGFPSKLQAKQWLKEQLAMRRPRDSLPKSLTSRQRHAPVTLSQGQKQVLNKVKKGQSVFFTGSAGSGKSVLLREIINTLAKRGRKLGITASTGIAAVNIGGSTVHSWAGIGLGNLKVDVYVDRFLEDRQFLGVRDRWCNVDTLIIDEVSMLDGALFDKLNWYLKEYIARAVRDNNKPFGGIQLVLSGDFCQLPPVPKRDPNGEKIPPIFAFDARTWDECVGPPVMLNQVFRQKDQEFVDMLNAMRFGQADKEMTRAFVSLSRKVEYTDDIEPTELFPTRLEVDKANTFRLNQLQTESHTYDANDVPGVDSFGNPISTQQMERLLKRLVVPRQIQLKVGAQVMLVKNLVQGELVNGSVGQIVRFDTTSNALAEGARIPDSEELETSETVKQTLLSSKSTWPVVRFINGEEVVMTPQEFIIENAEGKMEARRDQVPLVLAWALSIHKSQGQTLERVKVDLRRVFEKGQAYVALSRATCMAQLQVLNFHPYKVAAHPRVLEWHQTRPSKQHSRVKTESNVMKLPPESHEELAAKMPAMSLVDH